MQLPIVLQGPDQGEAVAALPAHPRRCKRERSLNVGGASWLCG